MSMSDTEDPATAHPNHFEPQGAENANDEFPSVTVNEKGHTVQSFFNGGVTKEIIKAGSGKRPVHGSQVTCHYTGTLTDGTKFDSSRDRDDPFTFTIGTKQVIRAWDVAIASMLPGEVAIITAKHEYAYGELGSPPTIPPKATLIFEVELLGWKPVTTFVCPGINKVVQEEGKGWKVIAIGGTVELKIKGHIESEDGPVFLDSESPQLYERIKASGVKPDENEELLCPGGVTLTKDGVMKMSVDSPALNDSLEAMLLSMKPGEKSVFFCSLPLAGDGGFTGFQLLKDKYEVKIGDQEVQVKGLPEGGLVLFDEEESKMGENDKAKENESVAKPKVSQLVYEVTCVHGEMPKEGWEMNMTDKLKTANEMKETANKLFVAKQYRRATERYDTAVKLFEFDTDVHGEDKEKMNQIKVVLLLNLAQSKIKQKQYKDAATHAGEALVIQPTNQKAAYRKAEALALLNNLDEAITTLKRGLTQPEGPLTADLKKLLSALEARQAAQQKKEKSVWEKAMRKAVV